MHVSGREQPWRHSWPSRWVAQQTQGRDCGSVCLGFRAVLPLEPVVPVQHVIVRASCEVQELGGLSHKVMQRCLQGLRGFHSEPLLEVAFLAWSYRLWTHNASQPDGQMPAACKYSLSTEDVCEGMAVDQCFLWHTCCNKLSTAAIRRFPLKARTEMRCR